jgi:hypothetical protein
VKKKKVDGAVFAAGDATQALRYQGSVNLADNVENILTQEDKLVESATWNKYNPGAVGRAEKLDKYLKAVNKSGPKAAPIEHDEPKDENHVENNAHEEGHEP